MNKSKNESKVTEGKQTETTEEKEEQVAEEVQERAEDKIAALEATIAELKAEAAKNVDGWRRAQASFENYRKRTEVEKKNWRNTANAALLMRLLPLVDDFDRAFSNIPAEFEGNKWLDGIQLVKKKLHNLLEVEQVKAIEVEPGQEFDPNYHEAIHAQAFEGFEEDQIISVVQRGYLQGERVLRPARVVVAMNPEREEDESVIDMDSIEDEQTEKDVE